MSEETAAPLGVFEEQVLLAVLRTDGASYGMRVRQEIEQVTGRDVAIGAVYATLDRLEHKGYVSSRRELLEGSERRTFRLRPDGAAALIATRRMRDRLWDGLTASLLRSASLTDSIAEGAE